MYNHSYSDNYTRNILRCYGSLSNVSLACLMGNPRKRTFRPPWRGQHNFQHLKISDLDFQTCSLSLFSALTTQSSLFITWDGRQCLRSIRMCSSFQTHPFECLFSSQFDMQFMMSSGLLQYFRFLKCLWSREILSVSANSVYKFLPLVTCYSGLNSLNWWCGILSVLTEWKQDPYHWEVCTSGLDKTENIHFIQKYEEKNSLLHLFGTVKCYA